MKKTTRPADADAIEQKRAESIEARCASISDIIGALPKSKRREFEYRVASRLLKSADAILLEAETLFLSCVPDGDE